MKPTFIVLMEMTELGLDEISEIPETVRELKRKLEQQGGELKGFYKVMGPTDYVAIFEAPDDNTALSFVMALGKSGYFKTTTLKAYDLEAMEKALDIYENIFET